MPGHGAGSDARDRAQRLRIRRQPATEGTGSDPDLGISGTSSAALSGDPSPPARPAARHALLKASARRTVRHLAVARLVLRLHRAARFDGPPSGPHQREYGPEFVTRRIAVVAARPCGTPVGHDTGQRPWMPSGEIGSGRTGRRSTARNRPVRQRRSRSLRQARRLPRARPAGRYRTEGRARNSPAKIFLKPPPETFSKAPSNQFRKARQKALRRGTLHRQTLHQPLQDGGPPAVSTDAAGASTTAENTTPAITIMRRFMAAPPVDRREFLTVRRRYPRK